MGEKAPIPTTQERIELAMYVEGRKAGDWDSSEVTTQQLDGLLEALDKSIGALKYYGLHRGVCWEERSYARGHCQCGLTEVLRELGET